MHRHRAPSRARGLLFCGDSGFGYVFGRPGPARTSVEAGGAIADGGCRPAPD